MIVGIPSNCIANEWPKLKPFFENFAKRSHGRWTAEGILDDVLNQRQQVFCVNNYQALVLTSVQKDSVNIDACAGAKRREWQDDVVDHMEEWAKALGKKYVISMARPGWSRFFKPRGFKEIHREFAIEVKQ